MGLGFEVLGFRVQGSTLSGIDERTKVSREVTDEEILEYSRSVKTPKAIPVPQVQNQSAHLEADAWCLTNGRETFDALTYINRRQDAQQMHYRCTELIAKVTGERLFAVVSFQSQLLRDLISMWSCLEIQSYIRAPCLRGSGKHKPKPEQKP